MTQSKTNNPTMASVSPDYNSLKKRFLKDMELAGLADTSKRTYLFAVENLIKFYWCSPELITEQQIEEYFLEQRRNDAARGTFLISYYSIRFLFTHTLNKDFHLFK